MKALDFQNKKAAVLGWGIEGQDVAQFLQDKGAKITVFDQKNAAELDKVNKFKDITFKLGKNYLQTGLKKYDFIFRSPAFKLNLPALVDAKKAGVKITSATKLFFALCPAKIIGVTGTKGKGTTATLITRILKQAGKKVFLAGNIGEPTLSLLPKLAADAWVVLELSSFQLQDLTQSPQIAVVLFITAEHLDYHQDLQEYVAAKTNIVRWQKPTDWAVINQDNPISRSLAKKTKAQVCFFNHPKKQIIFNGQLVGSADQLKLKGEHNWDNVAAAVTAAGLVGADLTAIKKAIFSFEGLEHRLEKVVEINGVEFYNDSFSTTPETTIAAIKTFKKPVILIAGGSSKNSSFDRLGQEVAKSSVKALILIGTEAEKIKKSSLAAGFKGQIIWQPKNMVKIIKLAFDQSQSGDVILLSPACASFGLFKNYKDRGQQFKTYAQSLKKNHP